MHIAVVFIMALVADYGSDASSERNSLEENGDGDISARNIGAEREGSAAESMPGAASLPHNIQVKSY